MDECIRTEYIKQEIFKIINNSGLSVPVGYYLFKDILHSLEKTYQEVLQEEIKNAQNPPEEEVIGTTPEEE